MKVLLSTDTVGGVWDYTATLVRALREQGHAVLLAVLGELDDARRGTLPAGVEVKARPFLLEWMPDAEDDVRAAAAWLRALASRWRPDVVHLNQMAYSAEPFAAPALVVAHSDVRSWFCEARGEPAPADWDRYSEWVRDGLAGATRVVAPSRYQSALLERHYGRPADAAIHNGVEPPAVAPPHGGAMRVLAAGRAWDDAKGMATLDQALQRLGAEAPPADLLGALDGPHGERFRPRALAAHGRVPRAEVDRWMERATVYCAPSLYEPFGLAPLEAALRGCALVLSEIGSFRELWDGAAMFFPPGDADALAEALRALGADRGRRERLARAAHERAVGRYTARRMTEQYLALYRSMAGHEARSPAPPEPTTETRSPCV